MCKLKILFYAAVVALPLLCVGCDDSATNPRPAPAAGSVDVSFTLSSTVLGRTMSYAVYLPPDYEESTRYYPVLYLLHGLFGNHTDWIKNGALKETADALIHDKTAPGMVVIMPDGLATFYVDDYQSGLKYERYFIEEFMPAVEAAFRIRADKYGRAIAGLSMGGYGSLYHGLRHRDLFCAVYALSAAVLTSGQPPSIHDMVDNLSGEEIGELPGIVLDCGTEDFLLGVNVSLDALMTQKGVGHQFIRRGGSHTWAYWKSGLPNLLEFCGKAYR